MFSKHFLAVFMIAACVHAGISVVVYFQSANFPLPSCFNSDCKPAKQNQNDWECELEGKVNNQTERIAIYLRHLQGDNYRIVYQNTEIKNLIVVRSMQGFITKIQLRAETLTTETNRTLTACGITQQKPNDMQKKKIEEYCNEEKMVFTDNSNC